MPSTQTLISVPKKTTKPPPQYKTLLSPKHYLTPPN